MSLQRRLTLIFTAIVILPLAAAGFFVQRLVVGEVERRAVASLDPALDATVAVLNGQTQVLPDRVGNLLSVPRFGELLEKQDSAAVGRFLRTRLGPEAGIDFLVALDKQGRVVASAALPGEFLSGFSPPETSQVLAQAPGTGDGFFRTAPIPVRVLGKGKIGSVVGGIWLDQSLLAASSQDEVILSVVAGDRIIASTGISGEVRTVEIDPVAPFQVDLGGESEGQARARGLGGSEMSVIASTPTGPIHSLGRRVLTSLLPLVLLALLGTTALAYLLARLITQPLEEVALGAAAIAEGRFDHQIPERSTDEVGQLATAFNDMTERLKYTVTELSTSRNQLQKAVRRVGETLRSTHDMGQMLESILNTAVDSTVADAGVLWRFTPTREHLYASTVSGLDPDTLSTIAVGNGAVGCAAERAANVLLPDDSGVRTTNGEPDYPYVIAVPLFSQDRVIGVLAVYREAERDAFVAEDVDTVVFLAEQGGVAIENVQLHEEARRLSLTDGLTGVWNRRFFQMQFRQVLATATRFDRPFSLLMLDIDHFKDVNDTFGHQRGDAVLVEFSQRVSQAVREVDTFARYGGEEFICLLSETELVGAMTTAQKICDVIRSQPFGSAGEPPVKLTVSVGLAAYPDHGDSFRALVEAADQALYRAKQAGRDRVVSAERRPPTPGLKLAR